MSTSTAIQRDNDLKDKREERLIVRISVIEKRKFEKMAKDRHTDISELTRQLLHKEAEAERA